MDTNNSILSILIYLSTLVANAQIIKPRIYGGTEACNNEFPYQGFLTIDGVYTCSVTLITKFHLLTAANCVAEVVEDRPVRAEVLVKFGSDNIFDTIAYPIRRISHHPYYKKQSEYLHYNDIAVIHLLYEVITSKCVSPIGLPKVNVRAETGTFAIVSGYGGRHTEEQLSPVLTKITTQILSYEVCKKWLPQHIILDSHICSLTGPDFGCGYGDRGNPMVDISKTTILAISSFSNLYCFHSPVNIYTEISPFMKYIIKEIHYYNPHVELPLAPPAVNFPFQSEQYFI